MAWIERSRTNDSCPGLKLRLWVRGGKKITHLIKAILIVWNFFSIEFVNVRSILQKLSTDSIDSTAFGWKNMWGFDTTKARGEETKRNEVVRINTFYLGHTISNLTYVISNMSRQRLLRKKVCAKIEFAKSNKNVSLKKFPLDMNQQQFFYVSKLKLPLFCFARKNSKVLFAIPFFAQTAIAFFSRAFEVASFVF